MITSVTGTALPFIVLMLTIVLVAAYVVDHPRILRTASQMRITLDYIPEEVVANPEELNAELSKLLGVRVVASRILNIDYVKEIVRAEVNYDALD